MEFIDQYLPEDKFARVNIDPDLIPIKIYLPKAPPLHLIDGYGLEAKDQMFRYVKMPRKLLDIEKKCDYDIEKIWDYIERFRNDLAEEIEFIKKQWYFRLNGYWFFNNGKPTYITGTHYYYLNYFLIDTGKPEYRDRDRKVFLFKWFCEKDTYDFLNKDDDGNAVADEDGYYHMYDTGRRVCLGDVYVKYRREGATYKNTAQGLEIITRKKNAQGGIQSRNEPDARKVFQKKLVPAFKKLAFFFKPEYPSSTDPKTEIVFDKQSSAVKRSISTVMTGLQSMINYEDGDEGAYDGQKLHWKFDDEEGKNTRYDVWRRHLISKVCLTENGGLKIIGFQSKASTAGEMEGGGGDQFKKECDQSNYYQRNATGQTVSGCYLLFISTKDGLEYNKYGISDIDRNEKTMLSMRSGYLKSDPPDMEGWCEYVRQHPLLYRECFHTSSTAIGFDIHKLSLRVEELRFNRAGVRSGIFVREDPRDLSSRVLFQDTDLATAKFEISHVPPDERICRAQMINGIWYPVDSKFTAGADSFRMSKTEGQRMSNGGGAVFWDRDYEIDPTTKDYLEIKTSRFVCTYSHRPPTTDEYNDDMLMMCQFFGAQICAETNSGTLIEYFEKAGYGGYLLYLFEPDGKTIRKTAGVHAGETSKEMSMQGMRNHIAMNCHREMHIGLLDECMSISSLKRLTDYDVLAAAGWALYGYERGAKVRLKDENRGGYDPLDLKNIFHLKRA